MGALGAVTLGAITNMAVMSSCDLLRYGAGSLGVMNYIDERTGECTPFLDLEDKSLKAARTASVVAFAMGLSLLGLAVVNKFFGAIQHNNLLISVGGVVVQLCLLMVYTAMSNGVCEVEGCSWGSAAAWLIISQLAYLTASVGMLYTDETITEEQSAPFMLRSQKLENPFHQRQGRRIELDLGLANAH